MSAKKALKWFLFWVGVALAFNVGVYFVMGQQKAMEFLGGYVIEKSLSIDNLFLFVMVFSSCGVKLEHQRRVLNYGIMGAILFRLVFVLLGVTIIDRLHWMLYVFGGLLIFSGIKMIAKKEDDFCFEDSKILKLVKRVIPVTDCLHGEKFVVRLEDGKRYATPLLAILLVIEFTDVIFAIDSIPAIFAISTDPFIVYSSNILAILGLRSMYFLLGNLHSKFWLVKYGVAAVLVFTGVKLGLLMFHIEIPIAVSLATIGSIIAASVLLSRFIPEPAAKHAQQPEIG